MSWEEILTPQGVVNNESTMDCADVGVVRSRLSFAIQRSACCVSRKNAKCHWNLSRDRCIPSIRYMTCDMNSVIV